MFRYIRLVSICALVTIMFKLNPYLFYVLPSEIEFPVFTKAQRTIILKFVSNTSKALTF